MPRNNAGNVESPLKLNRSYSQPFYAYATAGLANKLVISYSVRMYTYSIEKARQVLSYDPVPGLEDGFEP